MSKPWAKYEIGFIRHPKFLALNANAVCLWLEGKNYADGNLTDGLLPTLVVKQFRFYSKKSLEMLTRQGGPKAGPESERYAPFWEAIDGFGWKMHDYLEHNESREQVEARIERADEERDWGRRRQQMFRDRDFLEAVRQRDQDCCRYCGREVNWADRRGPTGATYDHIQPRGDNTLENVVIACRGCNSSKRQRTPEQAGMFLRPIPQSRSESSSEINRAVLTETTTDSDPIPKRAMPEKSSGGSKRPIYTSDRFAVFEWQLDELSRMLGPHVDEFDLHGFFDKIARQSRESGLVIPRANVWAWLQQQVESEARKRGLPMAGARGAIRLQPEWVCPHEPKCGARRACQLLIELAQAKAAGV